MAEVIVYTTKSCPWCVKAKSFLRSNGIKYIEKDVGGDSATAREMIKKSGQRGVPVITIGSKVIVGFDEGKLKKVFGIE